MRIVGRLSKAIGAISFLALLAGCATNPFQAGAAATIGNHVIKTKEVTSQLAEIETQLAEAPAQQLQTPSSAQLAQSVLNRLIATDIMGTAVAKLKISVKDSEVSNLRDSIFQQYGEESVTLQLAAQQGVPKSQLDSFFKLVLSQNYIGTTLNPKGSPQKQSEAGANYLINLAKSADVSVSPRYGVWNPSQMMASGSDNSLSFSIAGAQ